MHLEEQNNDRSSSLPPLLATAVLETDLEYPGYNLSQSSGVEFDKIALYAILPSSPEDLSEDSSYSARLEEFLVNLGNAADATADNRDRLHSITETLLGISQFQLGVRELFNPSVQDSVQRESDILIGGNRSVSNNLPLLPLTKKSKITHSKEIWAPSSTPKMSGNILKSASINQTNFRDPFRVNQTGDQSTATLAAAPVTTRARRELQKSDEPPHISHDESSEMNNGNKNSTVPRNKKLPDVGTSPVHELNIREYSGLTKDPTEKRKLVVKPAQVVSSKSLDHKKSSKSPKFNTIPLVNNTDVLESIREVPHDLGSSKQVGYASASTNTIEVKSPSIEPNIPPSVEKNLGKGKKNIRKWYRMTRRALMRKQVLKILVGRDLAEPAKESIKQSSKVSES